MPVTLDQIIEEARYWPSQQVAELVDRLTRFGKTSPILEEVWRIKDELAREAGYDL